MFILAGWLAVLLPACLLSLLYDCLLPGLLFWLSGWLIGTKPLSNSVVGASWFLGQSPPYVFACMSKPPTLPSHLETIQQICKLKSFHVIKSFRCDVVQFNRILTPFERCLSLPMDVQRYCASFQDQLADDNSHSWQYTNASRQKLKLKLLHKHGLS